MKTLVLAISLLFLIGCGGGDSSDGGSSTSERIKWSYNVGSGTYVYYSSVALSVDNQTLYVGTSTKIRSAPSRGDKLIALDRNGTLKWEYNLTNGEEVRSSPVVADNKILFIADYRTGEFSKNYTDLFCINDWCYDKLNLQIYKKLQYQNIGH